MAEDKINKQSIKRAAIWSFLEAVTSAGLSIVSIIFIARILTPDDYGKIASAQIISSLTVLALSFGMMEAVIQKKELSDHHISSAFWGTIFLSLIAFVFLLAISAFTHFYYHDYTVTVILIVEAFVAFLTIAIVLPSALLVKSLEMGTFTKCNLLARFSFFAIAIPLIMHGYGLWSVVWGNLMQAIVLGVLLFALTAKFLPNKYFFNRLEFFELAKFGFFVMVENLLWNVLSRVFSLLILAFHGVYFLGLFNMASRLTDAILNILNTVISRLALPVFSSMQDDKQKLESAFKKATKIFNIISMPTFIGMAVTAPDWLPLVLGEKWVDAVPVVQIICVMNGLMFSRIFVGTVMKAVGESKRFLYLSLVSAGVTLAAAFFTRDLTLVDTISAWAIMRVVITIPLGVWLMRYILGFGIKEQLTPVVVSFFATLLMVFVLLLITPLLQPYLTNQIYKVSAEIVIGGIAYLTALFFMAKNSKFLKDSL